MHEIQVRVVSAEAADYGTAELWAGGTMIGFTCVEEGDLVLRIQPRRDGTPLVVGAHDLADALAKANRLLASY
jgi:hypothetical protein